MPIDSLSHSLYYHSDFLVLLVDDKTVSGGSASLAGAASLPLLVLHLLVLVRLSTLRLGYRLFGTGSQPLGLPYSYLYLSVAVPLARTSRISAIRCALLLSYYSRL